MLKFYPPKFFVLFLFTVLSTSVSAQVFVKHDASGSNDGSSWANAYTELEDALAGQPNEIWVAAGTYSPGGTTADTLSTFAIRNDLVLYGGFDGTEGTLAERDPASNLTILNGDLNSDDLSDDFVTNRGDNVRHVVYVDSMLNEVIIDGFIVSGGHTNDFPDAPFYLRAGGGLYGLSPVSIVGCTFSTNFGRSGASVLLQGAAHNSTVEDCTFVDNMSSEQAAGIHAIELDDFTIRNSVFTENFTARGAVYPLNCTNLLIEDCEFSINFNDGGFGGALFSWANINFTLRGCDFSNNLAGNAGAIYFDERDITDNNADNLKVEDCTFTDNSTSGFGGGAIYMFQASMTVEGCDFDGNTSSNGGHIFQNSPGGNIIYRDCDFANADNAGWGGAATAYGLDANYLFEDCLFESNTTAQLGGAVNTGFGAISTFDQCIFEENTSTNSAGGALAAQNDSSTIIVLNSDFSNNKSLNPGGAIFAGSAESSAIVLVDNCEFFANTSETDFGGAIHVSENGDDNITTLALSNSIFGFNSAIDQGGALNVVDADVNITSCLFFDNFALEAGRGAISINASDSNSVVANLMHVTVADNVGAFSAGLSQWTGIEDASLNTTITNCLFQNDGLINYAIEDGDPQLMSMGGNMSDDGSLTDYLTNPLDQDETTTDFVDPDGFDFNLVQGSSAIDAGIVVGTPEFDLVGNPRINAPDIGAIENQDVVKANEVLLENIGTLQIYPNPVRTSHANISLENNWAGKLEVRIFDVKGELIRLMEIQKNNELFKFQLPLEDINTGVYQIAISNGEAVVVERMIRI